MEYQGTTFYFQFKENGTVTSVAAEPFYLEDEVASSYTLDYNGTAKILLTLQGNGALKYLSNKIENTLVITAFSSGKITATGWTYKEEMILLPTATTEWETLQTARAAAREAVIERYEKTKDLREELSYGVLRNSNNNFVALYKVSGDNLEQITFTYLENDELKHDSYAMTITLDTGDSENTLEFSTVNLGGNEVSKIYHNYSSKRMRVEGEVTVDLNHSDAIEFYIKEYRPMHKIDFNPQCGSTNPYLLDELRNAEVDEIDLDDRNPRNIIFCDRTGKFQWVGYATNPTIDQREKGHIYFERTDPYYPVGGNGHGADYIQENCSQFLTAFFDTEGFYMIRDQVGESKYLYMLSPSKNIWFKWEWFPGA